MGDIPITFAFFATTITSLIIFIRVLNRRQTPGSKEMACLVLATSIWSFTSGLELQASQLNSKLVWMSLSYLGSQTSPVLFYIFTLRYTRQEHRLSNLGLSLLWVVPVVSILLVATNAWHHLFWTDVILTSTPTGKIAVYTWGAWFWVQLVYLYTIALMGVLMLIRYVILFSRLYSRQTRLLLAAALAPFVANVVYVLSPSMLAGIDPTPVLFNFSNLLLFIALFRYRFREITPVAREHLIEHLKDGIVFLDEQQRIADINLAARAMLGLDHDSSYTSIIGTPAVDFFHSQPELAEVCLLNTTRPIELCLAGDLPRFLEISMTKVENRSKEQAGCIIILHDISARKQIERALQESESRYRMLIDNQAEGIGIVNLEEKLEFVNPAAEKIFGVEPGQLVGRSLAEFMLPEQFDLVQEQTKIRQQGHKSTYTMMITRPDTVQRILEVTVLPQFNPDHRYTAAFGLFRDVTEKQKAEKALHERQRFLELLNDITCAALGASDIKSLLQTLADRLGELIHADGCYITHWSAEQQLTLPVAASGPMRDSYAQSPVKPGELTMTKSVLEAGHALVAEDVHRSPYIDPKIAALYPTHSMLGLPLMAGDRKFGAALIAFNQPHIFTPAEIALGEQAAAQISLAVAKSRLLDELSQAHQETLVYTQKLEKLASQLYTAVDVSRAASSMLDLDQLLKQVIDLIGARFGLYTASLFLMDSSGQWAVLHAISGRSAQKILSEGIRLEVGGQSLIGWCIAHKQARLASDVYQDIFYSPHALLQDARAEVALPLVSRGIVIGGLSLQSAQINAFDENDVRVFQAVADQLANAIVNARLYEQVQLELIERQRIEAMLKRRAQELEALYATALDISSQLDLPRLLLAIVERAAALLDTPIGELYLLDNDKVTLERVVSFNLPNAEQGLCVKIGQNFPGQVIETGKTMMIADYAHWEAKEAMYSQTGTQRLLGVPLIIKGRGIGVLNIIDTHRAGIFSPEQVRLVSLFADQAAIAVENARLFGELQQANLALEELATTDKLTGAYNRRKLDEIAIYEIRKAQRYNHPISLIMFDIDHFKQVNDDYGHDAGDQALLELTKIIRENIRGSDWLIRWGGEEFIILAPGITLEQSKLMAEKIRQLVADHIFISVEHITISLGVTVFQPFDDLGKMIKRADEAMYQAKHYGRNRTETR